MAVVDGLGHGEGAAAAAKLAIATLEKGHGESPIALIQRCHEELRSTRGVVMSLAMFHSNDNTMTWLGVGNVEGFLLHRNAHVVPGQEALLLRAGVVGDHLPRLSASIIEVGPRGSSHLCHGWHPARVCGQCQLAGISAANCQSDPDPVWARNGRRTRPGGAISPWMRDHHDAMTSRTNTRRPCGGTCGAVVKRRCIELTNSGGEGWAKVEES